MTFHRINADKPSECVVKQCDRCGGRGKYHIWGTCFRCGGDGRDPKNRDWGFPVAWTDEQCQQFLDRRLARAEARRKAAAEKRFAKQDACWAANVAKCPLLADVRRDVVLFDTQSAPKSQWPSLVLHTTQWEITFLRDAEYKGHKRALSDKQISLVESIVAKVAERAAKRAAETAAAKPVPTGRTGIEGVVVSVRLSEATVGYRTVASWKALIRCDGYKLFGTIPAAVLATVDQPESLVGSTIRFTATCQQREPGFGFYSRPTGGEVLGAAAAAG